MTLSFISGANYQKQLRKTSNTVRFRVAVSFEFRWSWILNCYQSSPSLLWNL